MQHRQAGRLARLEQRFGLQQCAAHPVDIIIRSAATGGDDGARTECRHCGQAARLHVIELTVVPDRTRE